MTQSGRAMLADPPPLPLFRAVKSTNREETRRRAYWATETREGNLGTHFVFPFLRQSRWEISCIDELRSGGVGEMRSLVLGDYRVRWRV